MRTPGSRTDDRGTTAVELALVMPLVLVLLLGTIGFGRAFHTKLELSNAAQEGARALVFRSGSTTAEAVLATTTAASLSPPLTAAEVNVSSVCSPGVDVTVSATRRITFDYYLGTFDQLLTGRAVMRCAG